MYRTFSLELGTDCLESNQVNHNTKTEGLPLEDDVTFEQLGKNVVVFFIVFIFYLFGVFFGGGIFLRKSFDRFLFDVRVYDHDRPNKSNDFCMFPSLPPYLFYNHFNSMLKDISLLRRANTVRFLKLF